MLNSVNPLAKLIENHFNEIIEQNDHESIKESFNRIGSDLLKDYIKYTTWVIKGKPFDIHPNFGFFSYTGGVIDSAYYCTPDERN